MGRQHVAVPPVVRDALCVLASQVKSARVGRKLTARELAAQCGVSEYTVLQVERGAGSVSIGNALKVAAAAGVPLFGADTPAELAMYRRLGREKLALLPARVRDDRKPSDADLDF